MQFAQTLRKLCATRPSIAHVCRETGINRQQFNRYLSGEAVPRVDTLTLLARYFRVGLDQLLGKDGPTLPPVGDSGPAPLSEQIGLAVSAALSQMELNSEPMLKAGYYFQYCLSSSRERNIYIFPILIKNDGICIFRRKITISRGKRTVVLNHKGLVFSIGAISYINYNDIVHNMTTGHIKLFHSTEVPAKYIAGVHLVLSAGPSAQPFAGRTVFEYLGPVLQRERVRKQIGLHPRDSVLVPDYVREQLFGNQFSEVITAIDE